MIRSSFNKCAYYWSEGESYQVHSRKSEKLNLSLMGEKDYISVNIQGQTLLCGTEIYSTHFGI